MAATRRTTAIWACSCRIRACIARTVTDVVGTTQVAPTILALLGVEPRLLQAVVAENTRVLPGLGIER